SLQSALFFAVSGDTIKVAQGTYKPTTDSNRSISFQLVSGVAVLGGFAGSQSGTPDARDISQYPTILSGDIGTIGELGDNSNHVVDASNTASTALLDGFTITLGNVFGSYTSASGGGLYNHFGAATISNCTFVQNDATGTSNGGGAVFNYSASPTFIN